MPQFVSKNHKIMMERLHRIFIYAEVFGWPDAEINLGHLAGLSGVNLRADGFVRMATRQAVAIEWQSEIHTKEGCEGKEWFDYDDIAGRDDLKKQLCAKAGIQLVELWTLDMDDETLEKMIVEAADRSFLTQIAKDKLDDIDKPKESAFKRGEMSVVAAPSSFTRPKTEFHSGGKIGTDTKPEWKPQKFGSTSSFK